MKHAIDLKRAHIAGSHLIAENDACWENEGRDSEECRWVSERVLRGPIGWLLIVVLALLWAYVQL